MIDGRSGDTSKSDLQKGNKFVALPDLMNREGGREVGKVLVQAEREW